jgi:hypothetical protein
MPIIDQWYRPSPAAPPTPGFDFTPEAKITRLTKIMEILLCCKTLPLQLV